MDLSYSDEQRLLKDSLDKFIQQEYDFETRRKTAESEQGFSTDFWRTFAELGWLAVPFSEAQGGLDGGPIETMILMEAFGKGLVVEPWLSTVLMSGQLLAELGTEAQQIRYLNGIIQGESHCSVAHWENAQGCQAQPLNTTAEKDGDHYILNGKKQFVLNGQNADWLIVSACVDAKADSVGLFIVDRDQAGIGLTPFKTVEGGRAAHVGFEQVKVPATQCLATGDDALAAINQMDTMATFAVCAEAVGIMEVLYKTTVEYTKTRKQFGLPLGKFQALQHRMVNMFILHEQSQSLLLLAAIKLQEGGADAAHTVSGLKAWLGQAARKLGQEAIQLHGGMGMTDELNVGYYFKRLTAIDALFGNADVHLERYAQALQ